MFILCKISRFSYSARLAWNCLFTLLLVFFVGYYPQMNSNIITTPKRTMGACPRKIQYNINQVLTRKSHKTVIFHLSGEKPHSMDLNENLHWCRSRGHNHERQVQIWKISGFLMSWSQNSPFPIDFARGPYHSAALTRCLWLHGKTMDNEHIKRNAGRAAESGWMNDSNDWVNEWVSASAIRWVRGRPEWRISWRFPSLCEFVVRFIWHSDDDDVTAAVVWMLRLTTTKTLFGDRRDVAFTASTTCANRQSQRLNLPKLSQFWSTVGVML